MSRIGDNNVANYLRRLGLKGKQGKRDRRPPQADAVSMFSTAKIFGPASRPRARASLLACTALGTVLGISVLMPQKALAVNECGPIVAGVVTCSGNFPAGINYLNAVPLTIRLNGATIADDNVAGIDVYSGNGQSITVLQINNSANSINATNANGIWLESGNAAGPTGSTLTIGDRATLVGIGGPITATGTVAGFGPANGIRLDSHGGNIVVTTGTADVINVSGSTGDGILANATFGRNLGGNIDILTQASITSNGGNGINAITNGGGTIIINTQANVSGLGGDAIRARAEGGPANDTIDITTKAGTTLRAFDDGIDARIVDSEGTGGIKIRNNAEIIAGGGRNNDGIRAVTYAGNIDIVNTAKISAGDDGIQANCLGGGLSRAIGCSINIVSSGAIGGPIGNAATVQDDGIVAHSADGPVTVETRLGGTINTNSSGIIATSGSIYVGKQECTVQVIDGEGCRPLVRVQNGGDVNVTVGDKISAGTQHGLNLGELFGGIGMGGPAPLGPMGGGGGFGFPSLLFGDITFGALALSVGGAATVNVNAAIDPPAIGAGSITFGGGDATVNVNAPIQATLVGALAVNLFGSGDAIVNIAPTGSIDSGGYGVIAADLFGDGNVIVTPNGNIAAGGGDGILAVKGFGDGSIVIAGTADGLTGATGNIGIINGLPVTGDGIHAIKFFGDGDVTVNMAGSIHAVENGINVSFFGGDGNVTVTAGQIVADNQDGIHIEKIRGTGDVTVVANGPITAADDGIVVIKVFGDGNVSVTANNSIAAANDDGIFVDQHFGTGNTTVVANGAITAIDNGILVNRSRGDGNIYISGTGGSIGGVLSDGIHVDRSRGDGVVAINYSGNITAGDDGIQVIKSRGDGGPGGVAVDIYYSGDLHAGDDGISVRQSRGDGSINVYTGGVGSIVADQGDGIDIRKSKGDGNITVDNDLVIDAYKNGIRVKQTRGDGNISVTTEASITAGLDGIHIYKRAAGDPGNDVTVNVLGSETVVQGQRAIYVNTRVFGQDDSAITIYNQGTLIGDGSWHNPTIRLLNDGGKINITNDGLITTAGASISDPTTWDGRILRINSNNIGFWGDAGVTLTNNGTMIGRLQMFTDGEDPKVINNYDWYTSGHNTMGGNGDDQLINNGWIFTSGYTKFDFNGGWNTVENNNTIFVDGKTSFKGYGLVFNNNGLIEMTDGATDDRTKISGAYVQFNGGPYSELGVDAFLGGNGSKADRLKIFGYESVAVTGQTAIIVNDVNPGPGAYNTQGIKIVSVNTLDTTAAPDNAFYLSKKSDYFNPANGGVLSKGAFDYFLAVDRGEFCYEGYCKEKSNYNLYSIPGLVPRQLGFALEAAQNLWWESALLWEDRQLETRNNLMPYGRGAYPANVAGAGADLPVKARPAVPVEPGRGFGVWLKGLGSWTERDATDSTAFLNRSFTYDIGYDQKSYGIIGGFDAGANGMWTRGDTASIGLMGGYLNSKVNFNEGGTSFKYEGGTIGLTASYVSAGGAYFDVLGKVDLLNLHIDTPAWSSFGIPSTSTNVWTAGVIGETGYRFSWNWGWFVEPHLILGYAKTNIDDLNFANVVGTSFNWGNGDSFRGAIGARVGVNHMTASGYRYEASVVGRVWDEFLGDNNTVDLTATNFVLGQGFDGVFGELKGNIAVANLRTGWSGFLNGGVKFNDEFTTATVKGGVRYEWGGAPWAGAPWGVVR